MNIDDIPDAIDMQPVVIWLRRAVILFLLVLPTYFIEAKEYDVCIEHDYRYMCNAYVDNMYYLIEQDNAPTLPYDKQRDCPRLQNIGIDVTPYWLSFVRGVALPVTYIDGIAVKRFTLQDNDTHDLLFAGWYWDIGASTDQATGLQNGIIGHPSCGVSLVERIR